MAPEVVFRNTSGHDANLFVDNGAADPEYKTLRPDGEYQQRFSPRGEGITFQMFSADGRVATAWFFAAQQGDRCHTQYQALVSRP